MRHCRGLVRGNGKCEGRSNRELGGSCSRVEQLYGAVPRGSRRAERMTEGVKWSLDQLCRAHDTVRDGNTVRG